MTRKISHRIDWEDGARLKIYFPPWNKPFQKFDCQLSFTNIFRSLYFFEKLKKKLPLDGTEKASQAYQITLTKRK